MTTATRIAPAAPPFPPEVQAALDRTMPPGMPPLVLFTTLARDPRLFGKFFAGGLLDRGHLTLRQRELVIHRTTALNRSEYEWGVHAALFAARVQLTPEQLHATVHGSPDDGCWSDEDRVLLRLCDALHATSTLDDALWSALRERFSDQAMLELLLLAGFYRTVSYLTNALQLPLEANAARFPTRPPARN
ncbi:MAG TPA: carboxymuconolactone decarboxylase family protein [Burkholderiaceae bacterium]|nr:carboxymuconolactone decarboxylase family protein [Burkholderiaceae bacterium]